MRPAPTGLTAAAALLYLFLYAPIAVVILFSFNSSPHGVEWKGFSTAWYGALLRDPQAMAALRNSLVLALTSAGLATLVGTGLGFGLQRFRFRGQKLLNWILYIPVCIPDIVMAVSLLLFFALVRQWSGWFQLGMPAMILAHVTFQIPFVAIVVRSRLVGLDPLLEEAALDLGATPWQRFRHVTLPLLLPGIVAAALLAFTLSLDDFVISFFTGGPGSTTLPVLIYSSVKRGVTPEINALSTLVILASVAATLLMMRLQKPAHPA